MNITFTVPQGTFRHVGEISATNDNQDPRNDDFAAELVDMDFRLCEFVRPPALLWSLVYMALARRRGVNCRVLVPVNKGVCVYMNSIGFFPILKDLGVEIDDRGVRAHTDTNVILKLTPLSNTQEASDITNQAYDKLCTANLTGVNLAPIVTELFSELALNAAEHSSSEIGAFACIQFHQYEEGSRFSCVVADGGIGIKESLLRNPALRDRVHYDWDALELAVRERISGTGNAYRGIGLYGVREDVRVPGRSFLLHSGLGSLEISEQLESSARRNRLFPGTLAHLSIPA